MPTHASSARRHSSGATLWWLAFVVLSTPALARAEARVAVESAFPKLRFVKSLFLAYPPDGTDRIVVVEQDGRVLWFDNRDDVSETNVAVDLRKKVNSWAREEGLLGLAFHPGFKNNHQVFLYFTRNSPRRNVLARFTMDALNQVIDPTSEDVIMEVRQRWDNHHGGMIAFPPAGDGCLYIAVGDGGWGGDPNNNGQNKNTMLGKILRIDVDHKDAEDRSLKYAIPRDNPFVGMADARGEIWAYGLRNPWRFSFDRQTGELWAGDPGQDKWEEINLILKGANYGWSLREGKHKFQSARTLPSDLVDPIVEFSHPTMLCIIGGYVYRGKKNTGLLGSYIYGDYVTGKIYSLRYDPHQPATTQPRQLGQISEIASFGEDRDGEIFAVSLTGRIYRLVTK